MSFESDIHRDVDNYEQTIGALLAVAQHMKRDHSVDSWFGRKFRTTDMNKVSKNTDVTPDLTAQLNDYGIVVEAKKNFSREDDYEDGITQAKKYDDKLIGWNTQNNTVANHDIILLTHVLRGVTLEDRLNARINEFDHQRKVVIVEFARNDEVNASFVLRRRGTGFSSSSLDRKFHAGFSVRLEHLIPLGFSEIKFYDAEPPMAYLLQIIWDNLLSEMPTEEEYRKAAGKRKIEIEVSVDDLCEKLKQLAPKQNGVRLPEIPKKMLD